MFSENDFRTQQQSYAAFGFAKDPSVLSVADNGQSGSGKKGTGFVGDIEKAKDMDGMFTLGSFFFGSACVIVIEGTHSNVFVDLFANNPLVLSLCENRSDDMGQGAKASSQQPESEKETDTRRSFGTRGRERLQRTMGYLRG